MTAPRFAWARLNPQGTSLQQLVEALNRALPTLPTALNAAVRQATEQSLRYTQVRAEIIGGTDTQVTVRVTGVVPLTEAESDDPCHPSEFASALIRVKLAELFGAEAAEVIAAGPAVGTEASSGQQWTLNRPPAGTVWRATFESTIPDGVSDRDVLVIPPVGTDLSSVGIRVTARVVRSDDYRIDVALTVEDATGSEEPVTLTIDDWAGLEEVDRTPVTVTAAPPFTQAYSLARPRYGEGVGRALWKADREGGIPDYDAVDVPPAVLDQIHVVLQAEVLATDPTSLQVQVTATDPRGLTPPTITVAQGEAAEDSTITSTGERVSVYTVPRDPADPVTVIFEGVADGLVGDRDWVEVPEQGAAETDQLSIRLKVTGGTYNTLRVIAVASDPLGGAAPTVTLESVTGLPSAVSGAGTPSDPWVVPRPLVGQPAGLLVALAAKAGRLSDRDELLVPTVDRDTVTLQVEAQLVETHDTWAVFDVVADDPLGEVAPTLAEPEVVGLDAPTQLVPPFVNGTQVIATYRIDRPGFGTGMGQVTIRASATGRVEGQATVTIPELSRDTATLRIEAEPVGGDQSTMVIGVIGQDPVTGLALGAEDGPVLTVEHTGVSAPTDNGDGTWSVQRPMPGNGQGRVTFRATMAGRVEATDAVDVAEIIGEAFATVVNIVTYNPPPSSPLYGVDNDPRYYRVDATLRDPLGGGSGGGAVLVSAWDSGKVDLIDLDDGIYIVERNAAGGGDNVLVFGGVYPGRGEGTAEVIIPAIGEGEAVGLDISYSADGQDVELTIVATGPAGAAAAPSISAIAGGTTISDVTTGSVSAGWTRTRKVAVIRGWGSDIYLWSATASLTGYISTTATVEVGGYVHMGGAPPLSQGAVTQNNTLDTLSFRLNDVAGSHFRAGFSHDFIGFLFLNGVFAGLVGATFTSDGISPEYGYLAPHGDVLVNLSGVVNLTATGSPGSITFLWNTYWSGLLVSQSTLGVNFTYTP